MSVISRNRRDVTLTTLIDLLVQVVFVFTLLLMATGAIEGSPADRGYVAPEVWKTLISIFDVDPRRDPELQAKEIAARFRNTKRALEESRRQEASLRAKLREADEELIKLRAKLGGAPGLPPCRGADGKELVVAETRIDSTGQIVTKWLEPARPLEPFSATEDAFGARFSRVQFQKEFSAWRDFGRRQNPQCLYSTTVYYNPKTPAGEYQPSRGYVASIFWIRATRQENEE